MKIESKKWKIVFLIMTIFISPVFAVNREELNVSFFERFNDEYLVQYINEAIENNHSAKQAAARVEEYRQNVKSSFAQELPRLSVAANYLGVSVPKLNQFVSLEKNAFILPFAANYEADFLLKNRDKTKSAKKSYEMSIFDEKSVYIALLSDVATVYTNILEYDKLILNQEQIVLNQTQMLDSDYKKLQRGVINNTEYNNSVISLENSKNTLKSLIKQREILLMELALLCGQTCTADMKRGNIISFEYNSNIPDEIESDVIFSRPDVKRSEAALEKAKIDIRVARKEFLPTFNVVGIWSFNTIAPGTFFSWKSSLAALMAGATQDIFTGGRKAANLKFQQAKYEELFENYRQTDLEAVKEVNTALCIIKYDTEIENSAGKNYKTAYKNYTDSEKMLSRGVISKNQYLNSQNAYLAKDIENTKAKTQRLVDYYTLYKATGSKL